MSVRSRNPLALVAAVREQMRRAAVEPDVIREFSNEALSEPSEGRILEVCGAWVEVERD